MKYIYLIFLLILFCCKSPQQNKNINVEHIPINNPSIKYANDLIDHYDTIRLEVNDECLIKSINHLLFMDNKIYIKDDDRIIIFTDDGKYINKIDNKGEGPEEYISIGNLSLDVVNNNIIIADAFANKIHIYNANGNLEKIIKLDFIPLSVVSLGSGFVNLRSSMQGFYSEPNMENYTVHVMDSVGKVISYLLKDETPLRIAVGSFLDINYLDNGDILYQPGLCDTIYNISKTGVTPLYAFYNQSKYKFLTPKQKLTFSHKVEGEKNEFKEKEEQGYLLSWGYILNTDDYILFKFTNYDNPVFVYYSKSDKRSITVDPNESKESLILKEIFFATPRAAHNNYYYVSPSFPPDFDSEKIKDLPAGKLKTYLSNTNFYDYNPLLIKYKVKITSD